MWSGHSCPLPLHLCLVLLLPLVLLLTLPLNLVLLLNLFLFLNLFLLSNLPSPVSIPYFAVPPARAAATCCRMNCCAPFASMG
jgi:hypothetical protein